MEEKQLDFVLVPLGLFVLALYHSWLLFSVLRRPNTTVIGLNALARRRWVQAMMAVRIPLLLSLLPTFFYLEVRLLNLNTSCDSKIFLLIDSEGRYLWRMSYLTSRSAERAKAPVSKNGEYRQRRVDVG
ncbi:hypothetical protein KFK09_027097 [Dendrobium nobile]|uniref:Uncharacterized protein n=1 Tax=Dendrobium nobile TaxID=94219 RepID=A0A8T3AA37_DENNO|nr:hypothetical protein KFK09_027097 [Dendrobium nobile]